MQSKPQVSRMIKLCSKDLLEKISLLKHSVLSLWASAGEIRVKPPPREFENDGVICCCPMQYPKRISCDFHVTFGAQKEHSGLKIASVSSKIPGDAHECYVLGAVDLSWGEHSQSTNRFDPGWWRLCSIPISARQCQPWTRLEWSIKKRVEVERFAVKWPWTSKIIITYCLQNLFRRLVEISHHLVYGSTHSQPLLTVEGTTSDSNVLYSIWPRNHIQMATVHVTFGYNMHFAWT